MGPAGCSKVQTPSDTYSPSVCVIATYTTTYELNDSFHAKTMAAVGFDTNNG